MLPWLGPCRCVPCIREHEQGFGVNAPASPQTVGSTQADRRSDRVSRMARMVLPQQAMELTGGYVCQIVGDGFCAAFHTAS